MGISLFMVDLANYFIQFMIEALEGFKDRGSPPWLAVEELYQHIVSEGKMRRFYYEQQLLEVCVRIADLKSTYQNFERCH